jgi:hypothetical protein
MEKQPTFLQTYQTLIVGLLGFIAVMATLAFNAYLARRAERRVCPEFFALLMG